MKRERIQSVDFLRGLTILAMILVNTPGNWSSVYPPLLHAAWDGLAFADLVFPFFLFLVGISIAIAYQNRSPSFEVYKKIGTRSGKLILLGLFLNGFTPYFPFITDVSTFRIPGVLQRIGVAFFVVTVIYLHVSRRGLLVIGALLLFGYWILMSFMPFPDGVLPNLARNSYNWANYLDVLVFGQHIYKPDYDPEGLLSTFPSLVTVMIGVIAGEVLINSQKNEGIRLCIAAVLFLGVGYLWDLVFPINKALWSSSFVLVTAGYALLLFAICYYVMDYRKIKFGSLIKMVGANAITLYVSSMLFSIIATSLILPSGINVYDWLFQNLFLYAFLSDSFSSLLFAISVVALHVLFAYILYRNQIFIKV